MLERMPGFEPGFVEAELLSSILSFRAKNIGVRDAVSSKLGIIAGENMGLVVLSCCLF